MQVTLNTNSIEDYRRFLAIKRLPTYSIQGHVATFPDEYASFVGMSQPVSEAIDYQPSEFLFDYQRDIATMAIRKRKFAGFIDCGLKDEYYEASIRNLTRAEHQCKEAAKTLFDQLQEA